MTYTYEFTAYVDVSNILGGYDDYNSSPPFTFMEVAAGVAAGASAEQIILRTTDALGPEVCDWLDQAWSYFEMYADAYYDLSSRGWSGGDRLEFKPIAACWVCAN